jgi:hypothetical protein
MWSPAGKQIAWGREGAAGGSIWIMSADGTGSESLLGGREGLPRMEAGLAVAALPRGSAVS